MDNLELFFADKSKGQIQNWKDLTEDINHVKVYNKYCFESDFYLIFQQIIVSILLDEEIILLDSDFTEIELENLIGNSNIKDKISINIPFNIKDKEELINRIKLVSDSWKITLFTSGTTGLPKKISHSFGSITRFVKKRKESSLNYWGFAYNPTHMAGIQVFFQALINGDSIIRLFGLSKEQILDSIKEFSITHISATPTFYRLLLPIYEKYESVVRLTSGGEKFDEKSIELLNYAFPNAKITNVYASTEAGTLLASIGNEFTIKTQFEKLIKIEDNELLIHKSLMGLSDSIKDDWYKTGDLVEVLSDSPITFIFLSRKNEMINVGGYKVNPLEVEEAIRDIDGVFDVRVFAKKNSVLGNIVSCEIVLFNKELTESIIRLQLRRKLQEFKIPRMIRFVDSLSTTRTGKIKRN